MCYLTTFNNMLGVELCARLWFGFSLLVRVVPRLSLLLRGNGEQENDG